MRHDRYVKKIANLFLNTPYLITAKNISSQTNFVYVLIVECYLARIDIDSQLSIDISKIVMGGVVI